MVRFTSLKEGEQNDAVLGFGSGGNLGDRVRSDGGYAFCPGGFHP